MRGQRHALAAPYPGKDPVPIVQEDGWASGPVCTGAENLAPPRFDPRTVQPVGSRYTDYATRSTRRISSPCKMSPEIITLPLNIERKFRLLNPQKYLLITGYVLSLVESYEVGNTVRYLHITFHYT